MPGVDINSTWLYRIIHIDNLQYVLDNGMFNSKHKRADPNYINIGDGFLIQQRNEHEIGIDPPGGMLGDFVPFYFGPLSPMLLNIKTGHRGITQRSQQDIIYLCCSIGSIVKHCAQWCFTDGHAKNAISSFYNRTEDLNQVDINLAYNRYWTNSEDDFDRMRKKQAEFLVKNAVPGICIRNIVAFNQLSADRVQALVDRSGLNINVHVKPSFFY